MCQAGVAVVLSFAVEGIELIVRILPAFSEECEPLARKPKKMLIVIKPHGLRLEGESGDRELGHVQFLPVALRRSRPSSVPIGPRPQGTV